ncbi:MAG: HdeD family acid-resistance protein [Mycobacterium sp.]|nr:HdeD family acid-resistance protein [Mycobacterium sp.]
MSSLTQSDHPLVSRLWTSMLMSGVLTAVLGVAILVWPGDSLTIAAGLFGAYLLISGIAQVFFAFALHVSAGGRFLLFISGAASVVLAVLAFRHFGEGYALLLLAIWIGVGFVFRGVATSAAAVSDRGYPGRGWAIFAGVITVIGGLIVLAWPFDSIAILALVVGIWLVVIGLVEIISSVVMRKELA